MTSRDHIVHLGMVLSYVLRQDLRKGGGGGRRKGEREEEEEEGRGE